MKHVISVLGTLALWAFITIKYVGVSLAAWSWWWCLLSFIPVGSLIVKHFGL